MRQPRHSIWVEAYNAALLARKSIATTPNTIAHPQYKNNEIHLRSMLDILDTIKTSFPSLSIEDQRLFLAQLASQKRPSGLEKELQEVCMLSNVSDPGTTQYHVKMLTKPIVERLCTVMDNVIGNVMGHTEQ